MHRMSPTQPLLSWKDLHDASPSSRGSADVRIERVKERGIVNNVWPSCHRDRSPLNPTLQGNSSERTGMSFIATAPLPCPGISTKLMPASSSQPFSRRNHETKGSMFPSQARQHRESNTDCVRELFLRRVGVADVGTDDKSASARPASAVTTAYISSSPRRRAVLHLLLPGSTNGNMTTTDIPARTPSPTDAAATAEAASKPVAPSDTPAPLNDQPAASATPTHSPEAEQTTRVAEEQPARPQTTDAPEERISPEVEGLKAMFPDFDVVIL